MPDELVTLAVTLRRAWFTSVAPTLEAQLPGAWEALSAASVQLSDQDLRVNVPALYPVFPPVQPKVRDVITAVLADTLPSELRCVVRFPTGAPRPTRSAPTALDVYHWGDPSPDDWPALTADLVATLGALDEPARSVLAHAHVSALSQRVLWLAFPSDDARRAVGKTPGVTYALTAVVQAWRPKTLLVQHTQT